MCAIFIFFPICASAQDLQACKITSPPSIHLGLEEERKGAWARALRIYQAALAQLKPGNLSTDELRIRAHILRVAINLSPTVAAANAEPLLAWAREVKRGVAEDLPLYTSLAMYFYGIGDPQNLATLLQKFDTTYSESACASYRPYLEAWVKALDIRSEKQGPVRSKLAADLIAGLTGLKVPPPEKINQAKLIEAIKKNRKL